MALIDINIDIHIDRGDASQHTKIPITESILLRSASKHFDSIHEAEYTYVVHGTHGVQAESK